MPELTPAATGPVVCFGEMMLRLGPGGANRLAQADALQIVVAGAEANVGAALASLGHAVRMVTYLPANPLGQRAWSALAATGVDMSCVTRGPGRMGLYFLEQGAGLRPSAITYDRAGSAFAQASPADFDIAGALRGARLLHISGINPALGPKGIALTRAVFAAAKDAGVPICFDGNYRANLWDAWDSDPRAVLDEFVGQADILIGNHRDISLLLGQSFSGEGTDRRREAAEAVLAHYPGISLVASTARDIVTADHHAIAARVDARESAGETSAVDVTGIVDRIGSGDAFAAGVLHGWLEGGDVQTMAEKGLALGVLKHSLPGDFTLVTRAELDGFSLAHGDVKR